MLLRITFSSANLLLRISFVCGAGRDGWRPAARTHLRLMFRNVKSAGPLALRLIAASMTYPFGAARAELEKAFALPSVPPASESNRVSRARELSESDRAVALFEHPDH